MFKSRGTDSGRVSPLGLARFCCPKFNWFWDMRAVRESGRRSETGPAIHVAKCYTRFGNPVYNAWVCNLNVLL